MGRFAPEVIASLIVLTALMFVARALRRQAVLLATASSAVGDVATTPQRTVFRSTVDVIAVDVQVVDRDGNPIERIRPDDFEVRSTVSGEKSSPPNSSAIRRSSCAT